MAGGTKIADGMNGCRSYYLECRINGELAYDC